MIPKQFSKRFQWVIVGGGLQGCYFASRFSQEYGHSNIAILDLQPRLLHRWLQRSRACHIDYMRSTSVHHLAPHPNDLRHFARKHGYGKQDFAAPYLRPSLTLFNAHSQDVLQRFRLQDLQIHGQLYRLQRQDNGWLLHYCVGEKQACVFSQNVLLALGDQTDGKACHLSDIRFDEKQALKGSQANAQGNKGLCVVGSGISAAQFALFFLEQGRQVKMYSGKPLTSWCCFQFDSEPGWLLKLLPQFQMEADLQKRWQMIVSERHKGSVPPQIYQRLLRFEQKGLLSVVLQQPQQTQQGLEPPAVLATGLLYCTPPWLLNLAKQHALPLLSIQGTQEQKPALYSSLEWHSQRAPGLYLAGRLGELFLGPAAGNIAGARLAARYLPLPRRP